jgi:hypothetical protein
MKVVFFKENISFVKEFIEKNDDCVAFWYAPGLRSYKYLETIITLSSLYIEESLFEDFSHHYPEFISTIPYELFSPAKLPQDNAKPISFLASNDTISKSFKSIIDELKNTAFKLFCKPKENAKKAADELNIPAEVIHLSIPNVDEYSLLVLGNDWGITERMVGDDFLKKGKNVVCIQESSIDFRPEDGRMRFCSFPIFQGVATLQNLDINKMICAVIGNPRFEKLKPFPLPKNNRAFVNVNFTYGIFEHVRTEWANDILTTCSSLGIDYIISQHPRDSGDFTGFNVLKSNPLIVHQTVVECSVLISRFSALLTEAICLGRPVIYYNPHHENMHYKFESDNKMFFYATNKEELAAALKATIQINAKGANTDVEFIAKHLGVTNTGEASDYIKLALEDISKYPPVKTAKKLTKIKLYFLLAKRIIRKQPY